jgi:hypothetical protein
MNSRAKQSAKTTRWVIRNIGAPFMVRNDPA